MNVFSRGSKLFAVKNSHIISLTQHHCCVRKLELNAPISLLAVQRVPIFFRNGVQ
jgi:hypothetical protein